MQENAWQPPKSPHSLIQESLWPDEWKILVSCLLLNQTTRKQLDKVIDTFFKLWPDPQSLIEASLEDISEVIKPLGFWRRRPKTLKKFTEQYLLGGWKQPIELYGCGKYANDAWLIFVQGDWRSVSPQDHALNKYHDWLRENHEVY
jgi:methyl-CpG-binding domain protein 4